MAKLGMPGDIEQMDLKYPAEDGTPLRAKLHWPAHMSAEGSHPLIVLYHGGGFMTDSPESEEVTCRNFTRAFGAVCLSIDYRLAPGFKFPLAAKDAWASLNWAATHAAS
jgi:acetyl esterase/lipase